MADCRTSAEHPCSEAPLPPLAPMPAERDFCCEASLWGWPNTSLAELVPFWTDVFEESEVALSLAWAEVLTRNRWRCWLARPLWFDGTWRCPGPVVEACEVRA